MAAAGDQLHGEWRPRWRPSLADSRDGEIILVDQQDYLLFTPMLTEVAGGSLDTHHIVRPTHHLAPRIRFVQGHVRNINPATRCVTVGSAEQNAPEAEKLLKADHLVIAMGGVNTFRCVPGAQEHALTLKTLLDAALVRNRALALLARADAENDPTAQEELLTFVVVGGGYTGVDAMAALNNLVLDELFHFPGIQPKRVRTLLLRSGDRLLPELSSELAGYDRKLRGGDARVRRIKWMPRALDRPKECGSRLIAGATAAPAFARSPRERAIPRYRRASMFRIDPKRLQ